MSGLADGHVGARLSPRLRTVITTVALTAVLACATIYENRTNDQPMPQREFYTGRYWEYYGSGMGPHYSHYSGFLNESQDLSSFRMPSDLGIYLLRPPLLANRTNAVDYLASLSYDVSNFTYTFGVEDSEIQSYFYHVFESGETYISIAQDGELHVSYGHPYTELYQPNITREEALSIATTYLMEHTGIAEGAEIEIHHDVCGGSDGRTCITSFFVHVRGPTFGYRFECNFIYLHLDAVTGRINHFTHIWPDFELLQVIPHERLANMTDILGAYIQENNEVHSSNFIHSNETRDITNVSIVYHQPYGIRHRMHEGSPYYVYLPYVEVKYADIGLGQASPLVPVS